MGLRKVFEGFKRKVFGGFITGFWWVYYRFLGGLREDFGGFSKTFGVQ